MVDPGRGWIGATVGALISYALSRTPLAVIKDRAAACERDLEKLTAVKGGLDDELSQALNALTRAEAELEAEREKVSAALTMEDRLKESFGAAAATALNTNNETFLELANQAFEGMKKGAEYDLGQGTKAVADMIAPVSETMSQLKLQIDALDRSRLKMYSGLTSELGLIRENHLQLTTQTSNLVSALRAPSVRGQWGEIQLRRLIEMAGMEEYCDFRTQVTFQTETGPLRPDLVVLLPGDRTILVDSKVPLDHFLTAANAETEASGRVLTRHAKLVRDHIKDLGDKAYWDRGAETPDFGVMFMSDAVYSAAVREDASIFDFGLERNVVLAPPMMLIALLKTVAFSWRQQDLADNARAIAELGKELHDRLTTFANHFQGLRKGLSKAVEAFNQVVGSLETRVLVTARKFPELGVQTTSAVPSLTGIETVPREITAAELLPAGEPRH